MEYLQTGIISLVVILFFVYIMKAKGKLFPKPTNLAKVGLILILLGIVFSTAGRVMSYSFIGAAVVISIIDIIRIQQNKERSL